MPSVSVSDDDGDLYNITYYHNVIIFPTEHLHANVKRVYHGNSGNGPDTSSSLGAVPKVRFQNEGGGAAQRRAIPTVFETSSWKTIVVRLQ